MKSRHSSTQHSLQEQQDASVSVVKCFFFFFFHTDPICLLSQMGFFKLGKHSHMSPAIPFTPFYVKDATRSFGETGRKIADHFR